MNDNIYTAGCCNLNNREDDSMASNSKKNTTKQQGLTYKGKPLVRKGTMLYYGDPEQKYIVTMKVLDTKKVNELNTATKVSVELQMNNPALPARKRVIKKAEREGLYKALDVGTVWIEDAL